MDAYEREGKLAVQRRKQKVQGGDDAYMKSLGMVPGMDRRGNPIMTTKKAKNLEQAQSGAQSLYEKDTDYADVEVEVVESGARRPSGYMKRRFMDWKTKLLSGLSYIPGVLIVVVFAMLAYLS